MSGKEASVKTLFSQGERLMKNNTIIEDSSSCLFLMLGFGIHSFSTMKEKLGVREIGLFIKTR